MTVPRCYLLIVFVLGTLVGAPALAQSAKPDNVNGEQRRQQPAQEPPASPPRFLGRPPDSGPDNGYVKHRSPPAGMHAAIAWLEAIQDTRRRDEPGVVQVDWLKLHAVVDGEDRVLKQEDFTDTICGGLYLRRPWFGNGTLSGNRSLALPATFADGIAILKVSDRADKVWHWYGCGRSTLPAGTEHVWSETRLRIRGGAVVSLGLDYWRDVDVEFNPNRRTIVEAGDTRWLNDEDLADWTVVSFAKP